MQAAEEAPPSAPARTAAAQIPHLSAALAFSDVSPDTSEPAPARPASPSVSMPSSLPPASIPLPLPLPANPLPSIFPNRFVPPLPKNEPSPSPATNPIPHPLSSINAPSHLPFSQPPAPHPPPAPLPPLPQAPQLPNPLGSTPALPKKASDIEVVLLSDTDTDDEEPTSGLPPSNLSSVPVSHKRPRSPHVIDVDDDDQLRSLSDFTPLRHVRPRRTALPGLPLPGAAGAGTPHPARIHVSRGGGLFSVDNEGTVNIVDSDDEADLQDQHRLINTSHGMAALPTAQPVQPVMLSSLVVPSAEAAQMGKEEALAAAVTTPHADAAEHNAHVSADVKPGSTADPSVSLPFPSEIPPVLQNAGFSTPETANVTAVYTRVNDWDPIHDSEMNWQKCEPVDLSEAQPIVPVNGMSSAAELKGPEFPVLTADGWKSPGSITQAFAQQNVPVEEAALDTLDTTRKISFGSSHLQKGDERPEFMAIPSPGAARAHPVANPPVLTSGNGLLGSPAGGVPSGIEFAAEREGLSERGLRTLMKQNEITADATEEADTPEGLKVTLMPHQKRALAWMIKREKPMPSDEDIVAVDEECLGGILADDQGLGKTLTMIAFLLKTAPSSEQDWDQESDGRLSSDKSSWSEDDFIDDSSIEERTTFPWRTLIVCPPSLINQWKEEFETRIEKTHMPKICIYHGVKRERSVTKLKQYDVVLTTYATLVNEYPKVLKNHPDYKMRKAEKLKLPCRSRGPLCQMSWIRVVLDESQYVKNRSTESWNAVMSLKAEKRWCLSGTPIQNCVDDLYALFCFIRYRFVRNYEMWNKTWKKKLESRYDSVRERAFRQFQTITGVVLLRRTKLDEINGKPLITLPPRTTEVRVLKFDQNDESSFYHAVAAKTVIRFNKFLAEGSVSANYSNILLLLLRLRQASSHPFLIQYAQMQGLCEVNRDLDPRYATDYTAEDLEEAMELASSGHSLMELIEEAVRESLAKCLEPPQKGNMVATSFACGFCGQGSLWAHGYALPCGELICSQCRIRAQETDQCLLCLYSIAGRESTETFINADHLRREVHAQVMMASRIGSNVTAAEFKLLLQGEAERRSPDGCLGATGNAEMKEDANKDIAIAELKRRSSDECGAERRTDQSKRKLLDALSQHSTKIRVIMEELNKTRERGEGEKTLIFSQWTSMLDIVEFHARRNGHNLCRLDGSMTLAARQVQLKEFRESATKNVFLISLHAGGTGLNLTASSRVILCDVWWNPAVEEQAIDRAHRIGQTKPVHVVRFRMADTVEDDIYTLCERKRSMVNGTLGEKGKQNLGRTRLSQHEIISLFSGAAADVARNAEDDSAAAQAARNILNFSR